jgi:hypothetical protein
VALAVRREAAIFDEFKQGKGLAAVVFLLPLGQAALLFLPYQLGLLPAVVVVLAADTTVLFVARGRVKVFSHSGTDRTKAALNVAYQACGVALIAMAYVVLNAVLSLIVLSYH